MSRNGSGTMVKTGDDAVFDTVISESYYNNQINDIINALTQSVSKDGQTTLTGNLNAGSNKLTAMAVGTALTDSLTLGQAQNGAMNYIASDTGSADAYAIAPAPAITSYSAGQIFWFIAANNSTGASTIDVSGLGTKAIQIAGSAISGASITTGGVTGVIYDGTQFQLLSEDQTVSALTIADESSDTTCFVSFSTAATGIYAPKSGTNLTFNSSTGALSPTSLGATALSGTITGAAQTIEDSVLKDTAETTVAKGNFGATPAWDVSAGNAQWGTVDQAITSSTMTNWPASGATGYLALEVINGGAFSIVWPTSVDWVGGTAPTLTASGTDQLIFRSRDGGTTVLGWVAGLDIK